MKGLLSSILLTLLVSTTGFSQVKADLGKLLTKAFHPILQEDTFAYSKTLSSQFATKTIVGFGEATHGTREFRQGFVKMAKDLVQRSGFNVVLLAECGLSDTYFLNEYVVNGNDCNLKFNKNQSVIDEDFKELAEWLRNYNRKLDVTKRVWLLGADIVFLNSIAQDALTLSKEFGMDLSLVESAMLSELAFLGDVYKTNYFRHRELNKLLNTASSIAKCIRSASVGRALTFRQEFLVQSALNLEASIEWSEFWTKAYTYRGSNKENVRDSFIFRNLQWIKAQKPDARIVIFAHNGHIEKDYGNTTMTMSVRLGHLIRKNYGAKYYAVATEAGEGVFSFGAKISKRKDRVGNIFSQVGLSEGFVFFGDVPELGSYFEGRFTMTHGTSGPGSGNFAQVKNVAGAFDAVYYFPTSTQSTPLASRGPFEDFKLSYFVGDSSRRKFGEGRLIRVKMSTDFKPESSFCDGQSVSLSVLFLTKKNEFADFRSFILIPGKAGEYIFPVPENSSSAVVTVAGRGTRSVKIAGFEIDDLAIAFDEAGILKGKFRLEHTGDEINIERSATR